MISLQCPNCHGGPDLKFLTVLTTGEGAIAEDVYDVGRCPTCARMYFRSHATGIYRASPLEPLCPSCDERLLVVGLAPNELTVTCPNHPHHRFTYHYLENRWTRDQ